MEASELLQWLSQQTNSPVLTVDDIKISRQICFFLLQLTGKPQMASKIALGKTQYERSANFNLAKTLFGSELNLPFDYNIADLVAGRPQEIFRLLSQLRSLAVEEGSTETNDTQLDDLLDDLQDDLVNKMREAKEYREELDLVAQERDFYMDKLARVIEATRSFDPRDAEPILHIAKTPPVDFFPPK